VSEVADVLLVSLGATAGLRASDAELAASIERAGARVEVVFASAPRPLRTLALTDLSWAMAARSAARAALARGSPRDHLLDGDRRPARARPGAIRFDALAAANRPGRHGIWQRRRERRVLVRAPLLLPVSEQALAGAPAGVPRAVVVPIAVEASGPPAPGGRDIAAITYAADAHKKGLDRVLAAWSAARRPDEELIVAGGAPVGALDGVRAVGALPREDYRALLRRARVYVAAPRREEYGIAQLEALADGAMLVAAQPAPDYPALAIARAADARLVASDLAARFAARSTIRWRATPRRSRRRSSASARRASIASLPSRCCRRCGVPLEPGVQRRPGQRVEDLRRAQPGPPRSPDAVAKHLEALRPVRVGIDQHADAGRGRGARVHLAQIARSGLELISSSVPDCAHAARTASMSSA